MVRSKRVGHPHYSDPVPLDDVELFDEFKFRLGSKYTYKVVGYHAVRNIQLSRKIILPLKEWKRRKVYVFKHY